MTTLTVVTLRYKIGDRVIINNNCVPDYIGMKGKIVNIDLDTYDEFYYNVFFDDKDSSPTNEWFAEDELDLIAKCKYCDSIFTPDSGENCSKCGGPR